MLLHTFKVCTQKQKTMHLMGPGLCETLRGKLVQKAEETLCTGTITPLLTTKLMKWEDNRDHHFELNPNLSFYPLFQNIVDNLKHNKPLNGRLFLSKERMLHLFMRHLAVARGCVAAATSASACLNASILDAEQSTAWFQNPTKLAHCRRTTTDFDYRSLCNKAWRNWRAIEIA